MSTRKVDPRLAARLEEARRSFREHHARVEPDAAFVSRVALRLRRDPAGDLGWAAVRLLPASIAIALVLAWAVTRGTTVRQELTATPAETDTLAWLLGESETSR
jgi:hypothetical protein